MGRLEASLKKSWRAFELPGCRDHPVLCTYSGFDYAALPPIDEALDDRFDWLLRKPPIEGSLADEDRVDDKDFTSHLARLTAQSGVSLPASFVAFMQTPALHERIVSITACYLELPDYLVKTFGQEDGSLIHFLSDQQWCLHWYLYVNTAGEHFVIVSSCAFGFQVDTEEADGSSSLCADREIDLAKEEDVQICAPSFSEFIYRFWLENDLWIALTEELPLTPRQAAYVKHYRKHMPRKG